LIEGGRGKAQIAMMTNLWTDIDAIARLARSGQKAADASNGRSAEPITPPAGTFPPFPGRREFDIHAVDSPARVVTGDSYDFFFVNEETLAIVMADVSGKGIPAALLVGVTRSMVRHLSAVSSSPGDTLSRVNRILYQTELGAMYVTIFLGWYDTRTGRCVYANAGHPRPFRIVADGAAVPFGEVTGPILGILDLDRYVTKEAELGVGDKLVPYTDGVTDATAPDGEFFGVRRLADLLSRNSAQPVDRLCRIVADRVDEFQAHARQDDTTILALQRNL
jgi:sigma-B regulation protein RsbU (phosphoserine phosphatase)